MADDLINESSCNRCLGLFQEHNYTILTNLAVQHCFIFHSGLETNRFHTFSPGASGLELEFRTFNFYVAVRISRLTLEQLSKLLTYCVLRSTQPPTLNGTGNKCGFSSSEWLNETYGIILLQTQCYVSPYNSTCAFSLRTKRPKVTVRLNKQS